MANFWQNLVASAMGLPGVLLAIAMLRPMGSKRLQGWGFVAIAVASMAFAASLYVAVDKRTSFALTCLLVFAINWGVNVTSYVLPAEALPNPSIAYSCSLAHYSPTVAASLTYGCSRAHLRLQVRAARGGLPHRGALLLLRVLRMPRQAGVGLGCRLEVRGEGSGARARG